MLVKLSLIGQSNPRAFELKNGNYLFAKWDSTSQPGTYPPNMIFHWVSQNMTYPFYSDASSDYACEYFSSPRPGIRGLGVDGFSFFSSPVSQFADCKYADANNRFIGCAVLSLNSTGRKNIQVSWIGGTVKRGNTKSPRECKVRLQYRLGTSNNFSDFIIPVEYTSSLSENDSLHRGPVVLPDICNNQRIVQLRWIYFESSKNGTGSKPQLRVNGIRVFSNDLSTNIINVARNDTSTVAISNDILTIDLNNYYTKDKYEITMLTLTGKNVYNEFSAEQFVKVNIGSLPKGKYILTLRNTKENQTIYQKLLLE